jgi:hypothetical protein
MRAVEIRRSAQVRDTVGIKQACHLEPRNPSCFVTKVFFVPVASKYAWRSRCLIRLLIVFRSTFDRTWSIEPVFYVCQQQS